MLVSPFWGWGATLLAAAGYAASWRCARLRRHGAALLLLVLGGLLLRLVAAGDASLHAWDERYHALVAKNLIRDPLKPTLYADPLLPYDHRDWGANHVWVHKPPLPLWAMAASLRLLGVNETALRLPSVLLSTAGILLIWRLGRLLWGRRVAWLAAFLFSIHGLTVELAAGRTATDHVDLFFLVTVLAGVWASAEFARSGRRAWNVAAGVAIGLAVLSKWLPALVVFPVWLGLVARAGRLTRREIAAQGALLAAVSLAVWLPWQAWITLRYPVEAAHEAGFNLRHIREVLDGHEHGLLWHFARLPRIYGELAWLPLLWFGARAARGRRDGKRLALLAWVLLPYLFFTVARTKMQAYTILCAPAILLIVALFVEQLRRNRRRIRPRWLPALLTAGLILLPVRYSLERLKPGTAWAPAPAWVAELKELRGLAPPGKLVVFNEPRPIEAMFYADCVAYAAPPPEGEIERLRRRGYTVLVRPPRP